MSTGELDQDIPDREQIRALLAANIQRLDDRIQAEWAEELPPEAERLQLTRLRTVSQLARQYRLLARDADLDAMEEEVATLWDEFDGREGQR